MILLNLQNLEGLWMCFVSDIQKGDLKVARSS